MKKTKVLRVRPAEYTFLDIASRILGVSNEALLKNLMSSWETGSTLMHPPKKSRTPNRIRVSADLHQKIAAIAEERGVTMSDIVAEILDSGYDSNPELFDDEFYGLFNRLFDRIYGQ